jgi:VWFA-related protein
VLWKACAAVFGACLVAFASGLPAPRTAATGDLSVDIAGLDDSQFPNVSAVVNVLDAKGRPISGLASDNFSASIGGQPATVDNVSAAVDADASLAVVLAVDVSGSMAGDPLAEAQSAATDFVKGLSPQDSVAVVTFGDSVSVAQEFSTDKEAVTASLDGLQAGGNTALFEATSRAVAKAAESPSPRKVIILLSDGVDYGGKSTVSRDDSVAAARAAGIPLYTIGLGSDIDRSFLGELAQATGARFLETPTPQGLAELYTDIGNLLRGQYVLKLVSPSVDRSQPLALELTVTVDGATAVATKNLPGAAPSTGGPQISLQGLPKGQEIKSPTTIVATVSGGGTPLAVEFLVDGQSVARVVTPPFQTALDPAELQTGPHTLKVRAEDAAGVTAQTEVAFSVVVAGSSRPNGLLLVALLLVVVAGGALYLQRRRRALVPRQAVQVRLRPWSNQGVVIPLLGSVEAIPPPDSPHAAAEEPCGKLTVAAGPDAGREFIVGTKPLSIGSADWCDVVLSDADGQVGPEEARAWVHQDKLIFHKLTRLSVLASDGAVGGWIILQEGDDVTIGPHRLSFRPLLKASAEEETVRRAVDDAVRRFTPPARREPAPTGPTPIPLRPVDSFEPPPALVPEEEETLDEPVADALTGEAAPSETAPTPIWPAEPPQSEADDGSSDDSDSFPSSFTDRASA